jgi:uncharacterized membrane protein
MMFLIAGAALPRPAPGGRLSGWRGPVLLLFGATYGLLCDGLWLHPWWGVPRAVAGPALLDDLGVGLFLPAALSMFGARRLARSNPSVSGILFLEGLAMGVLWVFCELRRLFHGPDLSAPGWGFSEIGAYGVAVLLIAVVVRWTLCRGPDLDQDSGTQVASRLGLWFSLLAVVYLLGYLASPWWGPVDGPFRSPLLMLCEYVLSIGVLVRLSWDAPKEGAALAACGEIAAGLLGLGLATLLLRFGFHGEAMRAAPVEIGLETWTYSVAWALYGLTILITATLRGKQALRALGLAILLFTAAKVFIFDMAHLSGVVRAGSFLCLGVALLAAALAARRFGGAAQPGAETSA